MSGLPVSARSSLRGSRVEARRAGMTIVLRIWAMVAYWAGIQNAEIEIRKRAVCPFNDQRDDRLKLGVLAAESLARASGLCADHGRRDACPTGRQEIKTPGCAR